jgi:hypothetical protein
VWLPLGDLCFYALCCFLLVLVSGSQFSCPYVTHSILIGGKADLFACFIAVFLLCYSTLMLMLRGCLCSLCRLFVSLLWSVPCLCTIIHESISGRVKSAENPATYNQPFPKHKTLAIHCGLTPPVDQSSGSLGGTISDLWTTIRDIFCEYFHGP